MFKNQLAILKLGKNRLNAEITYFKIGQKSVKYRKNLFKNRLKISEIQNIPFNKSAKYRIICLKIVQKSEIYRNSLFINRAKIAMPIFYQK